MSKLKIQLKAGKKYSFCSCGHSKTLPFCDNEHRAVNEKKGTYYKSIKIVPNEDTTIELKSSNWPEGEIE